MGGVSILHWLVVLVPLGIVAGLILWLVRRRR